MIFVAFLSKNAYNIQRRLHVKFQTSIDWTQFPLDVEEEVVTCPLSIHKTDQAASSSAKLDPPTGIEVLPSPTWKWLHPKVSKSSSSTALCKNVRKIPSGACREMVSYNKDIIGWCQKIDALHINPSSDDFLAPFPKHIQLFTPMSKFVPLVYGH